VVDTHESAHVLIWVEPIRRSRARNREREDPSGLDEFAAVLNTERIRAGALSRWRGGEPQGCAGSVINRSVKNRSEQRSNCALRT
jgi:hypothetical protein